MMKLKNLIYKKAVAIALITVSVAYGIEASADSYPSQPIEIKVAYPPGGPADDSIRQAAQYLEKALNQKFVIGNVPGANGSIAALKVKNSKADGYSLLGTTGTDFLVAPNMVPSARYSPKAFHLLGVVGIADFILVSSKAHNFANVDELIDYAKNKDNKRLTIAHWGKGTAPHIVGADFQTKTGVEFLEVPYKGASPAVAAILGGHVDLTFIPLGGSTLGLITSGKVNSVGLAGNDRNKAVPNIPTLSESPVVNDFQHSLWSAIFAPPGTPQNAINLMTKAMKEWTVSKENLLRIKKNASASLPPMDVNQASRFLAVEAEKVAEVVKVSGIDAINQN